MPGGQRAGTRPPHNARTALGVASRVRGHLHLKQTAGRQPFGIFQQQQAAGGTGIAPTARKAGNGKRRCEHAGLHAARSFAPLLLTSRNFRRGHGRKQERREAQTAFAKSGIGGKVFKPSGRVFAAKGKVTPGAASLTAQQRTGRLMRARGQGRKPALHSQMAQARFMTC